MIRILRAYGKCLPNVKEIRLRLCTERDPNILEEILDEVLHTYTLAAVA